MSGFTNNSIPIEKDNDPTLSGNIIIAVEDVPVSLPYLKKANYAIIQIQENNVQYWLNGTAPLEGEGFIANVNDKITIEIAELKAGVKFISAVAESPAKVVVQYYKY